MGFADDHIQQRFCGCKWMERRCNSCRQISNGWHLCPTLMPLKGSTTLWRPKRLYMPDEKLQMAGKRIPTDDLAFALAMQALDRPPSNSSCQGSGHHLRLLQRMVVENRNNDCGGQIRCWNCNKIEHLQRRCISRTSSRGNVHTSCWSGFLSLPDEGRLRPSFGGRIWLLESMPLRQQLKSLKLNGAIRVCKWKHLLATIDTDATSHCCTSSLPLEWYNWRDWWQ